MPIEDPLTGQSRLQDNAKVSAIKALKECTCSNPTGRNIVLCIDGTLNQFNEKNSNVVELYSLLWKDKNQITYYNSGIGTYVKDSNGLRSWLSADSWSQWISQTIDIIVAWNLKARILDAYQWLAENYVDGDRIFLFGFSRGAYQVRVIAGMLHRVGLLHKGNNQQIPFAYELYMKSANPKRCGHFKEVFSRASVRAHFVGAWDTVSSIGLFGGTRLPETSNGMKHVCAFRHALALDERRVKFLPEYANGNAPPDSSEGEHIKEVWFSGSHSDIGGGNIANEASNAFGPAMRWMAYEATYFGLRMHPHNGAWERIPLTLSMGKFWWIVEVIPFLTPSKSNNSGRKFKKCLRVLKNCSPHFARPRQILKNQLVHSSVLIEIAESGRKPAPRLSADLDWNEENLEQLGMLEKDWYGEAENVLSRLHEATKQENKSKLPSADVHAFLTLASSGVGRYSIISQPGAFDVITAIFEEREASNDSDVKLKPDDILFFEIVIKLLADFNLFPKRNLDKFVAESLKDMNMQRMKELFQKMTNDSKHKRRSSLVVYIAPENTTLINRVEKLGLCDLTDNASLAHVALLEEGDKLMKLRLDVVDKDLIEKDISLKPRFIDDNIEDLAHVIRGLSHYYTFLAYENDTLQDSMEKITVSFFELQDTGLGLPRVIPASGARNLCENGMIDITVGDWGEEQIYGFEVTNNNENEEPLFPVLLYFDNIDFTISQCFPHTVTGELYESGLLDKGQSLTIGYGRGPGSSVNPFSFTLGEGYQVEAGFFRLILFEKPTSLHSIVRENSIFQMSRGMARPSLSRMDELPQAWGSITITAIQRRG